MTPDACCGAASAGAGGAGGAGSGMASVVVTVVVFPHAEALVIVVVVVGIVVKGAMGRCEKGKRGRNMWRCMRNGGCVCAAETAFGKFIGGLDFYRRISYFLLDLARR